MATTYYLAGDSKPKRLIDRYGKTYDILGQRGYKQGATTTVPWSPDHLFDANFARKGFAEYIMIYPDANDDTVNHVGVIEGTDYGLAPDPAGSGKTVAWMDNYRGLTHGNSNPRVGFEGKRVVKSADWGNTQDVYWFGTSFRIDGSFSQYTKDQYWLSITTAAFGAPYTTSSPMSFGVWPVGVPGKVRLVMGNAGELILPYDYQISTDQWYTIVTQFKFAYKSDGGWAKAWIAPNMTGENMVRMPLKGDAVGPYYCDAMGPGNNDGWHLDPTANDPNSPRTGSYSAPGSRAKVWIGHQKLAAANADWFDWVRSQAGTSTTTTSTQTPSATAYPDTATYPDSTIYPA